MARIEAGEQGAGSQRLQWDGRDQAGNLLPSGMYPVDLPIEAESETFHRVQPVGIAY